MSDIDRVKTNTEMKMERPLGIDNSPVCRAKVNNRNFPNVQRNILSVCILQTQWVSKMNNNKTPIIKPSQAKNKSFIKVCLVTIRNFQRQDYLFIKHQYPFKGPDEKKYNILSIFACTLTHCFVLILVGAKLKSSKFTWIFEM